MRVLIFIFSSILIGHACGGMILHNIRDNLHSKLYGHGLHGENSNQNSPIININNNQEISQESLTHHYNQGSNQHQESFGFQHSIGGHSRGDHGSFSNYGTHSPYGGNGGSFMNTNIKAGGLKYGHGGAMGGFGSHSSMKQESYNHREGPQFGQHHDTNIFGNTKIGTSSSVTSSSASSSGDATSSSASSSSSLSGASSAAASSSSSSVGDGGSRFNTRIRPWRYPRNLKF